MTSLGNQLELSIIILSLPHLYRAAFLYYQSFIYSQADTPVSCPKQTILKFTLKQLRHVSVLQLHHHQGAH